MKDKKESDQLKKRWPTKNVMNQIYENSMWGGDGSDFYSGIGSHDPEMVTPYVTVIASFLKSFKEPLTVCDLGCGDFNVGIQLVDFSKLYIGVDIVEDLIIRNKARFKKNNLDFQCLNICEDKLPSADCIILRQVMQHLSNNEIKQLTAKLKAYKYVLVTEHLPATEFIANQEIITGQGIRLKKNSGVDLTRAPFNLKPILENKILVVKHDHKSEICTTFYQIF